MAKCLGSGNVTKRCMKEFKKTRGILGPAILIAGAQFSIDVVTSAFVGNVGDVELAAVSIVCNVLEGLVYGIMGWWLVGARWQFLVAIVNIGSYYVLGFPIGVLLGYKFKFSAPGIWIGMLTGCLIQVVVLLFIILRANWQKEVPVVFLAVVLIFLAAAVPYYFPFACFNCHLPDVVEEELVEFLLVI